MKKINKALFLAAAVALISVYFTACFNPALYQINQDVAPTDSCVSGSINSIARYTVGGQEYLVLAGGRLKESFIGSESDASLKGLLYKKVESDQNAESNQNGQWQAYPVDQLPFALHQYDYYGVQNHLGEQIIKVLSGSEYLYLVTAVYSNDYDLGTNCPSKINLWAAKITDWATTQKADWTNLVSNTADDNGNIAYPSARDESVLYFPLYKDSDYVYAAFNVFSTNAPIQANRSVYLRSGNGSTNYPVKYYKIDGLTISETTTTNLITTGDSSLINNAAVVNGQTIFFTSNAVTTNETYTTAATYYYASSGYNVIYGTSSSDSKQTVNAGSTISSLAYCKDTILIGCGNQNSYSVTTDGGIEKVDLTNDIPSDKLGTFETNAQSQLLTSYIVMTLINATPENKEQDSTLYASLNFIGTASSTQATFSNIGLWAYYAQRGNWNRE